VAAAAAAEVVVVLVQPITSKMKFQFGTKKMVMGPETENNSAGESQKQITALQCILCRTSTVFLIRLQMLRFTELLRQVIRKCMPLS
jgi:hypothetical protein